MATIAGSGLAEPISAARVALWQGPDTCRIPPRLPSAAGACEVVPGRSPARHDADTHSPRASATSLILKPVRGDTR